MQSDDIAPHDDFANERADAEVKAAAFHTSIDQLVSRYRELMEITGGHEPSRELLMHVATAVQTLKQSLPVSRTGVTSDSEDSEDAHSQHSGKTPYRANDSHHCPKAPAGAASQHELAADAHPSCSAEQARHRDSAETRHASAAEDHGSVEPHMVAPGNSTSILGLMRSTFLRHARISSPPPDRSCSPARFNTDGTSIGLTSRVKTKHSRKADRTGAAYTVYKGNPFYQNSSVTLPIQPTECVPAGTDYPQPPPLHFKGIADTPFTGDMRSCPRWRDAFIRLVHAPGRYMQDCERLLYLQQCLDGPPLDLVSRYPINDLGYQFATAQLEETYFDPQQVRLFLRHDLQAVQPPTNNYADLLRFQQDIVHICGNFFQAGEDITENDWCFDFVMAKLPYSVRLVLFQRSIDKGESSPGTLVDLLEELQRILKIMRKASLYSSGPEEPAGSCSNEDRLLAIDCPTDCSAERDGGAFVGAIQHDTPKSRQPCAFCGARGQHWTSSCSKYVTVADRYDRVQELQLCSVCLRKDHWRTNAKTCRVPENRLCAFCGKARHHQALCPTFLNKRCAEGSSTQRRNNPVRQTDDDRRGRRQKSRTPKYGFEEARAQTNAQPATNQTVRQTDDDHTSVRTHDSDAPTEPDEDELEPFDPSSFYSGHAAVGVAHAPEVRTHGTFLECVMVTVFNPTTNKRKRVCAFFDCGSSGTFVSTELADALGLPNLGSESIRLDTFAQDKPVRLDTFRTTIGFDQTDGSCLVLDLKASPKLVPPLEAVFIEPPDEALLRRNRCSLVPQNVVPDILIGKDTEKMFLKEYEHPPLPNGFTLLRTTIGTILSGSGQFNQRSADLIHTAQGSADPTSSPGTSNVSAETHTQGSADPFKEASAEEGPAAVQSTPLFQAQRKLDEPFQVTAGRFWQTENFGTENNAPSTGDAAVLGNLMKTICRAEDNVGSYQIRLPGRTSGNWRLTKRKMLQQLMRISDPLGLTTPALVAAKLVYQQSFLLPYKWDDSVGEPIETSWFQATNDFATTVIKIPRLIRAIPPASLQLQLHICVDASKDTYGFASYIRVPVNTTGSSFEVSLVFSRCKMKPLSADISLTVPKMELMAIVLGARNALFLKEQLFQSNDTRVTIWSNSMIALQQLRRPTKAREQFVEDRLKEARELQSTMAFETRYVTTRENPGHIASHGIPAADLQSSSLWWNGIPFLQKPDSEWPAQPEALRPPTPTSSAAPIAVHSTFVSSCPAGQSPRLTRHGIASDDVRPAGGLPRISAENFQLQAESKKLMQRGSMDNDQLLLQSNKGSLQLEPRKCTRGRDAATIGATLGRLGILAARPSENQLVYNRVSNHASKAHKKPGRSSTLTSPDRSAIALAETISRKDAASRTKKITAHLLMLSPTKPRKHQLMLPAQHTDIPQAQGTQSSEEAAMEPAGFPNEAAVTILQNRPAQPLAGASPTLELRLAEPHTRPMDHRLAAARTQPSEADIYAKFVSPFHARLRSGDFHESSQGMVVTDDHLERSISSLQAARARVTACPAYQEKTPAGVTRLAHDVAAFNKARSTAGPSVVATPSGSSKKLYDYDDDVTRTEDDRCRRQD